MLIEIQNDVLKFIELTFMLQIIEVLVAVDPFSAYELNPDLNQYQCRKKSYDRCEKGKN